MILIHEKRGNRATQIFKIEFAIFHFLSNLHVTFTLRRVPGELLQILLQVLPRCRPKNDEILYDRDFYLLRIQRPLMFAPQSAYKTVQNSIQRESWRSTEWRSFQSKVDYLFKYSMQTFALKLNK